MQIIWRVIPSFPHGAVKEVSMAPLAHAMRAGGSNELLHFYYGFMAKASTGQRYVLIFKEDLSSYTWMFPSDSAGAETTAESLMTCMVAFGICTQWVSDQDTHFNHAVMR